MSLDAQKNPQVCYPQWDAYELVDCGGRRKLERFGEQMLIRGEPKAWWRAAAVDGGWARAPAEIGDAGAEWRCGKAALRSWTVRYGRLVFELRLTDMSKHVGIFPEQQPHWGWLEARLQRMRDPQVLNLFGYTGAATLVAAASGAAVTHVDASKPALAWARRNQELSGMQDKPIRWLLDDAFKFVAREVRRGRRYDAILLDPPSFGRGPKGEIWKVETHVGELLSGIRQLLNKDRGMVVLTLYNLEASSLMLKSLMDDYFAGGAMEFGELALSASNTARVLPLSLYARWERGI